MALTTASAAAFAVADAIIVESSGAQPGKSGFCTCQASFSWVDTSITTLSLILTALSSKAASSRASDRALSRVEGLERIMSFASVAPIASVK